jgi:hypothetical protein
MADNNEDQEEQHAEATGFGKLDAYLTRGYSSVTDEPPTMAPGMNTHDPLEEKASPEEEEAGDSTRVSRLYLDRTPEE